MTPDAKDNVLAVNAITFAPSATGLLLIGHEVKAEFAFNFLKEDGRLVEIREPKEVRQLGYTHFGWVHPGETLGGKRVSARHAYENGGFLYAQHVDCGEHKTYLYALTTSALKEASFNSSGPQHKATDRLSYGYRNAIDRAKDAQKQNEEATKILQNLRKNDRKPYKWWSMSPEAMEASPSKQNLKRIFFLSVFVFCGVLIYRQKGSDWDSDGEAWTTTEAIYFSVVIMSTVGYGDMGVAQDGWPMLFTAAYILVGVLVVFNHAGDLYDEVFHTEKGVFARGVRNLRSWQKRRQLRREVKQHFEKLDSDGAGDLDKGELAHFVRKARQHETMKNVIERNDRSFELDKDWELMRQKQAALDEGGVMRKGVTFPAFEAWWEDRFADATQSLERDPVDVALEAGKSPQKPSTWAFFKQHLLGSILVGIVLNIFVGAAVFKAIDKYVPDETDELSYSSYLWHCFITSTTVGFGDVLDGRSVSNWMLVWAIVHILVSVSWLSSTASQVTDALAKRRHKEAKVDAVNNELSEAQIGDLRHFLVDGKLNRWGFVLGKLIGQGAQLWGEDLTVENQIEHLAKQFDAFDEYGSGFLTQHDLGHMLLQKQQEQKLNQALEYAKNARWDDLVNLLFPPDANGQRGKCELPNDIINSLPMGRSRKPRQYGLIHQLIASARKDINAKASCLNPLNTGDRFAKQGLLTHHRLVKHGIKFDYSLKTSKGDTCMDVTQGNRHTKETWHNEHFAKFLLLEDITGASCPSDEFRRHDELYKLANAQDWTAVMKTIFEEYGSDYEQKLSDTLINSLPMAAGDDGLFRRWGGLLHQLAESTTDGPQIHNELVKRGVSFNYNLKTFDYKHPGEMGKTCDKIAAEKGNKEFLQIVQGRRLEESCKLASKMQNGQDLIDLIFDRDTHDQLVKNERIKSTLVQISSRQQQPGERWGLLHFLANWTDESRDTFDAPYNKRKCTGTAVHDILCDKGCQFDYGIKSGINTELLPQHIRSPHTDAAPLKTRTCVEVALAAKNNDFTNMLLNLICNSAKNRKSEQLDDILFDNEGHRAIPDYLLNSLPVTGTGKHVPGLLHYLAAWVEPKQWKDPDSDSDELQEWTGVMWHDRLLNKGVKLDYSLKSPRGNHDDVLPVLSSGPKTVSEIAQAAGNTEFLKRLINLACDYARSMKADELEELMFDSSGNLLIPVELVNSLPEGRHGKQRWGLLHQLAAWSTTDPETKEDRAVNGLTVHDHFKARGVRFDYSLQTADGKTAVQIARKEANDTFVKMLEQAKLEPELEPEAEPELQSDPEPELEHPSSEEVVVPTVSSTSSAAMDQRHGAKLEP